MQAVRQVALAADPRITESIKWSTPTFSYKGNIFSVEHPDLLLQGKHLQLQPGQAIR